MSFHSHLHEHSMQHQGGITVPFIIALGLFGMVFSLIGNVKQTYEMYPLFLHYQTREHDDHNTSNNGLNVPVSFVFSVISDVCLIAYGIIMYDFIIIGYAGVNIFVILFVMMKLSYEYKKFSRVAPT